MFSIVLTLTFYELYLLLFYFGVLVNILFNGCIALYHMGGSWTLKNTYYLNSLNDNFQAEQIMVASLEC